MEPEKLTSVFAENMRRRRRELGITQAELSDRTGIRGPDLSDLELGKRSPNLTTVARVAEGLSIPPSHLLSNESLAAI